MSECRRIPGESRASYLRRVAQLQERKRILKNEMPGVYFPNLGKPAGYNQSKKMKTPGTKKTPGQQGLTMPNDWSKMGAKGMDFLRQWVKDQKKSQGAIIATAAGSLVTFELNIQQQGKFLLGFGFVPNAAGTGVPQGLVNISLNNESFITDLPGDFLNVALIEDEFYFYPRPMTGLDKITVKITDTIAQNAFFAAYYI